MKKYSPIDLSPLNTYSLKDRHSKVTTEQFAKPYAAGMSFRDFVNSLPKQLAGQDLPELVSRLVKSHQQERQANGESRTSARPDRDAHEV